MNDSTRQTSAPPDIPPCGKDQIRLFLTAAFGHLHDGESFAFKPFKGTKPQRPRRFLTTGFHATEIDAAAEHALRDAGNASISSVYVHVNPIISTGPLGDSGFVQTCHITRRIHIVIDTDPVRFGPDGRELVVETVGGQGEVKTAKAKCNATEAEKAEAIALANHVRATLTGYGFPSPVIVADSGNGWHTWYAIDLPVNPETDDLLRDFLQALEREQGGRFAAHVDLTMHDAPRIARVVSSMNRKYAAEPGRPVRESTLIEVNERVAVPVELIRKFVADNPNPETEPSPARESEKRADGNVRAGDAYNAACGPADDAILDDLPAGSKIHRRFENWLQITRPGKASGTSATWGYCQKEGKPLLRVFSDDFAPFEAHKVYDRFGCYARTHHQKDFRAATIALVAKGYGDQPTKVTMTLNGVPLNGSTSATIAGRLQAKHGTQPQGAIVEGPLPWPDLLPLGEIPDPPDFPLEVFPRVAVRIINEVSAAVNCPKDYAAVAAIGVSSIAVAGRVRLLIKRGWTVSASTYVAYIAPPGDGKTAPLSIMRGPLDAWESTKRKEWEAVTAVWEQTEENEGDEKPPAPILDRRVASNTTMESLLIVLRDNPNGIILIKNELSGLFTGMNQYKGGKGDDRQQFIDLWDGVPIHRDRKSDKECPFIHIEKPFLSILGTLQPAVVPLLHGDDGRRAGGLRLRDGLFDRFLLSWACPREDTGETWAEVSDSAVAGWEGLITKLLNLSEDALARPTEGAREVWVNFTRELAAERNSGTLPDLLREQWAKMKTYVLRLGVVLHSLRWAAGEVTELASLDGETLSRAVKLVRYFMGHARRVSGEIDADPVIRKARRVVKWLAKYIETEKHDGTFRRYDAHQSLRGSADFELADGMDEPLRLLASQHYIRLRPTPPGTKGRPPEVYEINPSLLSNVPITRPQNAQNDDEEPGSDESTTENHPQNTQKASVAADQEPPASSSEDFKDASLAQKTAELDAGGDL
jgi:Protein of unknown function (DUF3987)